MARVYERKAIDLQRAYALLAEGKTQEEVARILGVGERTLQRRLREEKEEHSGVPARTPKQRTPEVHRGTPNGTPRETTSPGHSGTPEPSKPKIVIVRQTIPEPQRGRISHRPPEGLPTHATPQVHQSTPWLDELAAVWPELKALVEERRARQHLLSRSTSTPQPTDKKTYVVSLQHIGLIQRYSDLEHLALTDVVNMAFREFFERRGYLPSDA